MASISKKLRLLVAIRAVFCCEYCRSQEKYSPDYFSVEHIFPRVKKGTDALFNLAFACLTCNNHKYTAIEAIDPVSGILAPLYNPRTDIWEQHFRWSDDYSLLTGITPTGRATVKKMHLNRVSVVNLRVVLAAIGKHPPF
jgi:HNH endonuclease